MKAKLLRERAEAAGIKVATAESCTGGMVAVAITDVMGSATYFDRGFITYSNDAKEQMLGVKATTLADHGAVSEEVAREMADGAVANSAADLAVSTTGIAGPTGTEHKPVGRVCFGLARKGRPTHTETVDFGDLGRDGVRRATVDKALDLLLSTLPGGPV